MTNSSTLYGTFELILRYYTWDVELNYCYKLLKIQRKERGNKLLVDAINTRIHDIEEAEWKTKKDVLKARKDADCVHSEGFYFFNIEVHRTMVLIEFSDQEATVIWAGNHKKYENTFKNTKGTIEKWLRNNGNIK